MFTKDISIKKEDIIKSREVYLDLIKNELTDNIDQNKFINSLYSSVLDEIGESNNCTSLYLDTLKMDVYCLLKFLNRDDKKTSIIYTGSDHIRT